MKLSLALILSIASQWLVETSLGGTNVETPRMAPQCKTMDPDGQCVAEQDEEAKQGSPSEEEEDIQSLYPPKCGMYLAESSIPNSGWGMYSNRDIEQGSEILPLDAVVQVLDAPLAVREGSSSWLLSEYVWNPDMTKAQFDADEVNSVVPGLGMLANSHPGLVNAANEGPLKRRPWTDRSRPVTGSFTHYHDLTFSASDNIAKGQELFVEYGDNWFLHRTHFGLLPLSGDFMAADDLLRKWRNTMNGDLDDRRAHDLWETTVAVLSDFKYYERRDNALPKSGREAAEWMKLYPTETTARATVPNLIRSEQWLEENGMCLDNIHVKDAGEKGKGAFATRLLPKGSLVAPAPVVHLSQEHTKLEWKEGYDIRRPSAKSTIWKGHQLLLNYCYGNPMTSLLFFPYAPAVNLINHGRPANVAIRWSNHTKTEMLEWSTEEVLRQNHKAGLMMEIYAVADIQPGDEILLDYGDDWQHSWDVHNETFIHPVNSENYKVAWDYDNAQELFTQDDPRHPPPYVETRCWIDYDEESEDADGFYEYAGFDSNELDDTVPCTLTGKEEVDGFTLYKVTFFDEDKGEEVKVKGVEWNFVTYVDKKWTGNQHLRQGFRHFIELPDEMIPPSWRDMDMGIEDNSECDMYLAESAIPNSGLGMYTARGYDKGERIGFGDLALQVEDILDNASLRLWYKGDRNRTINEKEWLLEHYYWTAESSMAQFDAGFIESMVPGFGMLANSHTGLHNADMRLPYQPQDLHRARDPGAGAATTYHDVHYVAERRLDPGEEIFVIYGDNYFAQRHDLSFVPLSSDFKKADRYLARLMSFVDKDLESEMAKDLFDVMLTAYENSDTRLANALPKSLDDAKVATEKGTADLSVPDKTRSKEWLKENGVCIDNIMPGKSRIIQAGRGAFATRKIKEGDVISPVPVVQILREHLEIYDGDDLENPSEVWFEGHQIFLNYCYGHPESSLLLFPYAPSINYVNHHHTKYNAEVRWSTHASHKGEWLEMAPREMVVLDHAGLIMDMVATRDIEVGEEIYLNYGDDWEKKWNDYVAGWKPNPEDDSYIPASVLNTQVEWLRTSDELASDPYPPNVFTGCFLPSSLDEAREGETPKEWRYTPDLLHDANHVDVCDIIKRSSDADSVALDHERDSYNPPAVTYTVVVPRTHSRHLGPLTVSGVPRAAIVFLDQNYVNDQYKRDGFRHEIGLPDEMVPGAWRDLKGK